MFNLAGPQSGGRVGKKAPAAGYTPFRERDRGAAMTSTEQDPVRIFVTHRWTDHDDYRRFFEYIGEVDNFFYENLTRPGEERPASRLKAEEHLSLGISAAEVLVVLAPVWEEEPALVELQIALARRHRRAVIALRGSGTQTFPRQLEPLVDAVVIWNERLIVDAILLHGRGDDTNRFEVIDFP